MAMYPCRTAVLAGEVKCKQWFQRACLVTYGWHVHSNYSETSLNQTNHVHSISAWFIACTWALWQGLRTVGRFTSIFVQTYDRVRSVDTNYGMVSGLTMAHYNVASGAWAVRGRNRLPDLVEYPLPSLWRVQFSWDQVDFFTFKWQGLRGGVYATPTDGDTSVGPQRDLVGGDWQQVASKRRIQRHFWGRIFRGGEAGAFWEGQKDLKLVRLGGLTYTQGCMWG